MKRLYITIIIILQGLPSFSQQSYQVFYKARIGETKFDSKTKETLGEYANVLSKMTAETTQRKMEILKDLEFKLDVNKNESLYYWEEETRDETVQENDFNSAILIGGGKYIHYQSKSENLYLYQFRDLNGKWQREFELLDERNWQITGEMDSILGYPVIKAVYIKNLNIDAPNPLIETSYKEEAWFAPSLPVPFGPAGVGGLPGLILKYNMGSREIYAVKIKLLKKKIKIKKPNKGNLRSIKEATEERVKDLDKIIQN